VERNVEGALGAGGVPTNRGNARPQRECATTGEGWQ
jgi:hypothetical protein